MSTQTLFVPSQQKYCGVCSKCTRSEKQSLPSFRSVKNRFLEILGVSHGQHAYKGPFHVQIDLTNDCNNNCIACWCNSPLISPPRLSPSEKKMQLPYPRVIKLIDELVPMGLEEIYFSGSGEPFMYPYIFEVLEHAKKKGVVIYINTNFTLLSKAQIDSLIKMPVDFLTVSVWAASAAVYEQTHPNKTADDFYSLKERLICLNTRKKKNPQIKLYNVLCNVNYHEFEDMIVFAEKLHCESVEFALVDTMPGSTDILRLNKEQTRDLARRCSKISQQLDAHYRLPSSRVQILNFENFQRRLSDSDDVQSALYDKNVINDMPCYIGWLFARIIPNGEVHSCLKAHRIPTGNIFEQPFRSIWNSPVQRYFRAKTLACAKDDPFFRLMGNDPTLPMAGCYKSCDDIGRNTLMYERMKRIGPSQKRLIDGILWVCELLRNRHNSIRNLGRTVNRIQRVLWKKNPIVFWARELRLFRSSKKEQFSGNTPPLPERVELLQPGPLVVPPEIKDIIASEDARKRFPGLIPLDQFAQSNGRISQFPLRSSQGTRVQDLTAACFYGKDPESHRWGTCGDEDDFHVQTALLRRSIHDGRSPDVNIGVRRTNFYALDAIVSYIQKMRGISNAQRCVPFSLKPLHTIKERFELYVSCVNEMIKKDHIRLVIADERLSELLAHIQTTSRVQGFCEDDFLRALGPVAKGVFIGPSYILFNLCGICNTDCVYCRKFSGYLDEKTRRERIHPGQQMDLALVEQILAEAKDMGVTQICIVGEGEPTLYPHFGTVLDLIKQHGLICNISTNGMVLDKYAPLIVGDTCLSITISMSFATERTFTRMRPKTDPVFFRIIENNVRSLVQYKKKYRAARPEISILHALCRENYAEIPLMVKQAHRLGVDAIWFQLVHLGEFSYDRLKLSDVQMEELKSHLSRAKKQCERYRIKFHSFIDFELRHYDQDKGDWSRGGLLQQGCFVGWHFAYVDFRKTLCFCCGVKTVGLLDRNHALKYWWYSDAYRRYRNDGLILHKENPVDLMGKPLYDAFCDSCDNHNQNAIMQQLLRQQGLSTFVER